MDILARNEWYVLLEALGEKKGTVILLGATDTGKSTLSKFLINHLCRRRIKVALVDADIGQSFLGPPTTIGFSLFESSPDWESPLSPEIFFVGSTTPEGDLPLHLKGVVRMIDRAASSGAEVILVDTTGLVFGELGKELKRRKIDLLSPCTILALQKSGELEPILEAYKESSLNKIYRLPLSEHARPRSKEERKAYRVRKFQEYFYESQIQELTRDEIRLEGRVTDSNGISVPLDWALRINGLLLGLKDMDDSTLALGVIKGFEEEKRRVRVGTPLRHFEKVKTIQLSSISLTPSYEESYDLTFHTP